jgi:hypothetical protein
MGNGGGHVYVFFARERERFVSTTPHYERAGLFEKRFPVLTLPAIGVAKSRQSREIPVVETVFPASSLKVID